MVWFYLVIMLDIRAHGISERHALVKLLDDFIKFLVFILDSYVVYLKPIESKRFFLLFRVLWLQFVL